jgi:ankyrin repeat protein
MNVSKATRECKNLPRVMREVRDKKGRTQLYYYCVHGMKSSVMRILEMRSIEVDAMTSNALGGETCLVIAAFCGHLDICHLLIDKGVHIEAKNSYDDTPLNWAARFGRLEIVRLLCDHGADVEARNKWGMRPLHVAAYFSHISVVKVLIEVKNAEINARNVNGETALFWARVKDYDDIAAYLVSHGGVDG